MQFSGTIPFCYVGKQFFYAFDNRSSYEDLVYITIPYKILTISYTRTLRLLVLKL